MKTNLAEFRRARPLWDKQRNKKEKKKCRRIKISSKHFPIATRNRVENESRMKKITKDQRFWNIIQLRDNIFLFKIKVQSDINNSISLSNKVIYLLISPFHFDKSGVIEIFNNVSKKLFVKSSIKKKILKLFPKTTTNEINKSYLLEHRDINTLRFSHQRHLRTFDPFGTFFRSRLLTTRPCKEWRSTRQGEQELDGRTRGACFIQ